MTALNDNPGLFAGLGANPCVTVTLGAQTFALPIALVEDVFAVQAITPTPLAPPYIAGLINLRGAIVTAVLLSERLGLPAASSQKWMAIGVGFRGEKIGLLTPNIGDVIDFPPERRESIPGNLRPRWAAFAAGVHRRDGDIVIELNVESLMSPTPGDEAQKEHAP